MVKSLVGKELIGLHLKEIEQKDDWSFRRSKWFEHVGNECKNVQENVGLLDMTAFAKCRISWTRSRRISR